MGAAAIKVARREQACWLQLWHAWLQLPGGSRIAAVQQSVVRSPTPARCPLPAPAAAASDADDEGEAKLQPKKRKPAAAAAAKAKPAAAAKAKPKAPLIPRKQQAAKQGGWPGGSESVHYAVVVTCALGWLGLLSY